MVSMIKIAAATVIQRAWRSRKLEKVTKNFNLQD